jgi:hypothetical protein
MGRHTDLPAGRRLRLWGPQVWGQCPVHHQRAVAAPHLLPVGLPASAHGPPAAPRQNPRVPPGERQYQGSTQYCNAAQSVCHVRHTAIPWHALLGEVQGGAARGAQAEGAAHSPLCDVL